MAETAGGAVMLEETRDREEIIGRVAALDIAKAEAWCAYGCPARTRRVAAGRRSPRIPR